MKKLIIGKNSRIVKEIRPHLDGFDFISHKEIDNIDILGYDKIYLFSFSRSDIQTNYEIIDKLPLKRVIYISTIAVYSLLLRRQWAKYPRMKHELEKYVFSKGGSILRLGVWADDNLNKISGKYQCTSLEELCVLLNDDPHIIQRIVDLYHVRDGKSSKWNIIRKSLDLFDRILPNFFIFKAPLIFLYRKFNFADYGYSKDAFSFCRAEIVVGEGCFGSAYLHRKNGYKIVVSPSDKDVIWTDNGFRGTITSFRRHGLSELWHRVYVDRSSGNAVKRFDIRRHRHFTKRINSAVLGLELETGRLKLGSSKVVYDALVNYQAWNADSELYYDVAVSKIALAAGTLINGVLLCDYTKARQCVFSDHKTTYLGDIDAIDVPREYLRRFLFFIQHTGYQDYELNGIKYLIDYRPNSGTTDGSLYLTSAFNIIIRLMSSFSFFRINEAFYNRFKISLATRRIGVWAQIEDKHCITFENNQFTRKDALDIRPVLNMMREQYPSFECPKSIKSIDSQHIVWAPTEMTKEYYDSLDSGRLKILGSTPAGMDLGSDHHTVDLRRSILRER